MAEDGNGIRSMCYADIVTLCDIVRYADIVQVDIVLCGHCAGAHYDRHCCK